MICQNCGKEIGEDVKFCPHCGKEAAMAQGGAAENKEPAPAPNDAPTETKKKFSKKNILLGLIIGALYLMLKGLSASDGGNDLGITATDFTRRFNTVMEEYDSYDLAMNVSRTAEMPNKHYIKKTYGFFRDTKMELFINKDNGNIAGIMPVTVTMYDTEDIARAALIIRATISALNLHLKKDEITSFTSSLIKEKKTETTKNDRMYAMYTLNKNGAMVKQLFVTPKNKSGKQMIGIMGKIDK